MVQKSALEKKTIPFPLSYRLILFGAVETDKRINRRIRYLQYDHADLLQSCGCDLARPHARMSAVTERVNPM